MNVVSQVTASLVLAGALSAFGQETAANTSIPLSQPSTEGTPLFPATRMNASAILRDATTTCNVDTDTIASVYAQSSSEAPQMSKRQVKTLIRNAKTSEDHRRIASCLAQQARIFAKKSQEYQALAARVAAHPTNYKTKQPSAFDDSQFWEQYFARQSREAEGAANFHEQLARSLMEKEREIR